MPRYFFDIDCNGRVSRDRIGHEYPNLDSVRAEAMKTLPEIANDLIPRHGDDQSFTLVVRDDDGHAVYSATLGFSGRWLTG